MSGLEAIPKLTELLRELIQRAKDRETQALVQEIQTHQLVIQTDLMDARAKILQMETDHAHTITAIRESRRLETAQLNSQIEQLNAQLSEKQKDKLDDGCNKMLACLANAVGSEGITSDDLIQHFNLPKAQGDHLFDQLIKRKFVKTAGGQIGHGMYWGATSEGREYLAKFGLFGCAPGFPPKPSRRARFGGDSFR